MKRRRKVREMEEYRLNLVVLDTDGQVVNTYTKSMLVKRDAEKRLLPFQFRLIPENKSNRFRRNRE